MRYKNFPSAGPWTALANLLTLQGHAAEDCDIVLGARLHCILHQWEDTGAYLTGASLQGPQWYNLYLRPRGWEYVEFAHAREEALDYLWPLTMLRLQVHAAMPTDAVYLGDVDGVYTFIPSVHAAEGEKRIEMSREELLKHLPEKVTLGAIRRCEAREEDVAPLLELSVKNWGELREKIRAFMQEERTSAELRDGLNTLLRAPLSDGQTVMRLLGREEDAKRLMDMHHQAMRAVTQGEPLRLADRLRAEDVEWAIDLFEALARQEMQSA